MNWIGWNEAADLLGMTKAGFYRTLNRLKVEKKIGNGVRIWVVGGWGAVKYPDQDWKFSEERIRKWVHELLDED